MPDISADVLRGNVLVVDDKEADRRLVEAILESAGYSHVTSTGDPASACALHRENHYDLIILDLLMPGADGFAVMRELREVERDGYLPVLAMTSDPELMARALQEGARDFIGKPFNRTEVLARVRNMLHERLLLNRLRDRSRTLEDVLNERTAYLRERESHFRALVEQSIAGIYMVEDGRFVYANPSLCEIFGYSFEELRRFPAIDLVIEEDRDKLRENRRRAEAGDLSALVATYRMMRRDGRIVHLAVEGKHVTGDGRRVVL
jgi:PAS domain S-box-containing protein